MTDLKFYLTGAGLILMIALYLYYVDKVDRYYRQLARNQKPIHNPKPGLEIFCKQCSEIQNTQVGFDCVLCGLTHQNETGHTLVAVTHCGKLHQTAPAVALNKITQKENQK